MGDVLIKNIEMPKEGRLTLQISADGAVYVVNSCRITAETYTTDAVPIPPHGRLIDADALNYTMLYKENWMRGTGVEAPAVWKKDIEDAPTIIPASEEGE